MTIFAGRTTASVAAFALLANSFAGVATSYSADMLGDELQEETLVEFGTGWYLRGDVGGGFANVDVSTNFTGDEKADLGKPVSLSIAAGYELGNGFRLETALNHFNNLDFSSRNEYPDCGLEDHDGDQQFRDIFDPVTGLPIATAPIPVTGECFFSANANVNASSIMFNGYYDIKAFKGSGITPYVGVGAGVAYVSWNEFRWTDFCEGSQAIDCGTEGGVGVFERATGEYEENAQFTYSANAMAGVSIDLSQNTTLDLGYRYTYIGGTGIARAADNPANRSDLDIGALDVHEVRVGLRYAIW